MGSGVDSFVLNMGSMVVVVETRIPVPLVPFLKIKTFSIILVMLVIRVIRVIREILVILVIREIRVILVILVRVMLACGTCTCLHIRRMCVCVLVNRR